MTDEHIKAMSREELLQFLRLIPELQDDICDWESYYDVVFIPNIPLQNNRGGKKIVRSTTTGNLYWDYAKGGWIPG